MDPTISINGLAEALKQCSGIAEQMQKALEVIVRTPHIKSYLALTDPQALKQAQAALGMKPDLYPTDEGYEVANVVIEALNQFVDNSEDCEDDERQCRKVKIAERAIERVEAVLIPLITEAPTYKPHCVGPEGLD
jgi:hypothetical protein